MPEPIGRGLYCCWILFCLLIVAGCTRSSPAARTEENNEAPTIAARESAEAGRAFEFRPTVVTADHAESPPDKLYAPRVVGIITQLKSRSAEERRTACKSIFETTPMVGGHDEMAPAAAVLCRLAHSDADLSVRVAAIEALGPVAPCADTPSLDTLVAMLVDDDDEVRCAAAHSLCYYGATTAGRNRDRIVPVVLPRLHDNSAHVRETVIPVLLAFEVEPDILEDSVVSLLYDENFNVRRNAARALGTIGSECSSESIDLLLKRTAEEDLLFMSGVLESVGSDIVEKEGVIAPFANYRECTPTLTARVAMLLFVDDERTSRTAATVLGYCGEKANPQLEQLSDLYRKRHKCWPGWSAGEAIWRISRVKVREIGIPGDLRPNEFRPLL